LVVAAVDLLLISPLIEIVFMNEELGGRTWESEADVDLIPAITQSTVNVLGVHDADTSICTP